MAECAVNASTNSSNTTNYSIAGNQKQNLLPSRRLLSPDRTATKSLESSSENADYEDNGENLSPNVTRLPKELAAAVGEDGVSTFSSKPKQGETKLLALDNHQVKRKGIVARDRSTNGQVTLSDKLLRTIPTGRPTPTELAHLETTCGFLKVVTEEVETPLTQRMNAGITACRKRVSSQDSQDSLAGISSGRNHGCQSCRAGRDGQIVSTISDDTSKPDKNNSIPQLKFNATELQCSKKKKLNPADTIFKSNTAFSREQPHVSLMPYEGTLQKGTADGGEGSMPSVLSTNTSNQHHRHLTDAGSPSLPAWGAAPQVYLDAASGQGSLDELAKTAGLFDESYAIFTPVKVVADDHGVSNDMLCPLPITASFNGATQGDPFSTTPSPEENSSLRMPLLSTPSTDLEGDVPLILAGADFDDIPISANTGYATVPVKTGNFGLRSTFKPVQVSAVRSPTPPDTVLESFLGGGKALLKVFDLEEDLPTCNVEQV